MRKILIFYTSALGKGHKRSAEALQLSFKKLYPNYDVILIDSLANINKLSNVLISKLYKSILKYATPIWKLIYSNERRLSRLKAIVYIFSGRFKRIIELYKPDIVICTQAFPCIVLSRIKKNYKLVAVMTDFNINSYWINKNIDLYTVPTEETRNELIKQGINDSKIKVTGIPIKKIMFKEKNTKDILILGGGAGLLDYEEIIKNIPQDYNLKVILGNNKKLDLNRKNLRLYSYVNDIERLYASSKFVITKPGGLTLSELIFINKPMILVNPLPGQEQKNADYLLKNNAALRSYNIKDIPILIKKLENKSFLKEIKKNLKEISRQNASESIVKLIGKL